MRSIRFVGLIQRLSCLNKNSNVLSKTKIFDTNVLIDQQSKSLTTWKKHSSYGSEGSSSEFNRSEIIGTLLGAALFGTLAFEINKNYKECKLMAKEPNESINERIEDFLKDAKKDLKELKEVEDEAKEVLDETIEIGQEVEIIGEEVAKAAKFVEKVVVEIEQKVTGELLSDERDTKLIMPEEEKFLPEIPSHAQYLIVGGGTAAMAAFKSIRANDENAKVLVVTEEDFKPYMRPPLSKDLWMTDDENLIQKLSFKQYNGNERSLYFLDDEFYVEPKVLNEQENGGVAILTGRRVVNIDSQNKTVKLDNSWEIGFDKCLLATGGRPKSLEVFKKFPEKFVDKVTLFRNIKDFEKLHEISKQGKTIAVVGGGFLGSELVCALAHVSKKYGGKVIQVFPESGNLQKVLPEYLTKWTTKKITEEGVDIVSNAKIVGAQINDNKVELQLEASKKCEKPPKNWLLADHVVVAVGLEPNVELASNSGFEVDPKLGGFLVNAELQARNSVWVAGDAACFYDIKLGRRRVEHHDHAVVSGRLAGENMVGACKPYWHQSMFWSDLGPKIGFEAIGLVDSSLQTVGLFAKADDSDTPDSKSNNSKGSETSAANEDINIENKLKLFSDEEFDKGVVLYLKNEVVVGCLMWNVFKQVPIARQLIQSQEKITDYKEMAKLFKINAIGMEEE